MVTYHTVSDSSCELEYKELANCVKRGQDRDTRHHYFIIDMEMDQIEKNRIGYIQKGDQRVRMELRCEVC